MRRSEAATGQALRIRRVKSTIQHAAGEHQEAVLQRVRLAIFHAETLKMADRSRKNHENPWTTMPNEQDTSSFKSILLSKSLLKAFSCHALP